MFLKPFQDPDCCAAGGSLLYTHSVHEIHGYSFDDSCQVPNLEDKRTSLGVANEGSSTNASGQDVCETLPTYFATR